MSETSTTAAQSAPRSGQLAQATAQDTCLREGAKSANTLNSTSHHFVPGRRLGVTAAGARPTSATSRRKAPNSQVSHFGGWPAFRCVVGGKARIPPLG
jgi:hypothetical protein